MAQRLEAGDDIYLGKDETVRQSFLRKFTNASIHELGVIIDSKRFGSKHSARLATDVSKEYDLTRDGIVCDSIRILDGNELLTARSSPYRKKDLDSTDMEYTDFYKEEADKCMSLDSFMRIRKDDDKSKRSPELQAVIDKIARVFKTIEDNKGKIKPNIALGKQFPDVEFHLTPDEAKLLGGFIASSEVSSIKEFMRRGLNRGINREHIKEEYFRPLKENSSDTGVERR